MLNDPEYVEAARAGRAPLREGGDSTPARDWVFRAVLSRPPRPDESPLLASLVAKHLTEYRADPASALALIRTGERAPAGLNPAELAAWTSAARVVLNLHETITRN